MNARTKSKLRVAVRSVAIASPLLLTAAAGAAINGPYSLDGNTAYLFHLDEATGSSVAANQQTVYNNAIGFQQTSATVAGAVNTTILGAAGRTGFGNAATFSGNLLLGYDGDANGSYSPDIGAPSSDAVASSLFTDVGGSGAFTLEAMVSFTGNLVGGGNREIVSFDSSAGAATARGFQFRLNNAGQLEYNSIGDGDGGIVAAVPTTGTNAYAANTWFHVAMVYDGNGNASPGSVRLYWTKMDDAANQANLIGTGSEGDLPATNNMLVLGNENRNTAGEALAGLLDEVRISNVPRAANQMMFSGAILNYWNNAGGGDWDAAANWTVSVPNAPAAVAILGGGPTATTADSAITLNGTKTLGSLTFDNGFKFTLTSGLAGALSLNNGAGVASAINALSGSHEIAVPVSVGTSGVTVTTGATSTLTVSGNVGGAGAVNKTGSGTLVLTGTNNYTGATTLAEGTLRAASGVGLPNTSNLVMSGGVLETGGNFERAAGAAAGQVQITGGTTGFSANGADMQVAIGTLASPTALQWGSATFNPAGLVLNGATATNAIEFKNAVDLNGAARTVAVNANVATMSGALTDTLGVGGLTKSGAGTLVLSGTNTYSGQTLVTGGNLRATIGVGLPAASNLSLNGGQLETSGTLTRVLGVGAGEVQLPGGNSGFTALGGDLNVTIDNGGTPLLWGGATFNPAVLVLNNSTSTNNVNITSDIDTNGAARTIQVNAGVSTFNGVISGTGSLQVNPNASPGILVLTRSNTYTGGTVLNNSPGIPTRGLSIVRAAADNALGTGMIDLGPQGNETQARLELIGGISLPNTIAFRGRNTTSDAVRNVSGNNTISGQLQINTGGANYWVQSDAGTLTLSGADPAAAGVAITSLAGGTRALTLRGAGDGIVSGALQNGSAAAISVTKDGAGTWAFTGPATYTGPTTVNDGVLRIATNLTGSSAVSVTAGKLEVASGGGSMHVVKTPSVTIGATARIDLRDNKLLTSTPVGTFTAGAYTGIQGEIARAYDFGSWDLPGLMTSMPDAGPLVGTTTIGVSDGATVAFLAPTESGTFAGQTITGATTLAVYTYAGDVNFDGLVDASDYGIIDNYFQFPGTTGYANGDFNYDGIIDAGDYGIIDNTFQLQGAPIPMAGGVAGASDLSAVTAVPEPASLSVIGMAAAAGLLARRGRRSRK